VAVAIDAVIPIVVASDLRWCPIGAVVERIIFSRFIPVARLAVFVIIASEIHTGRAVAVTDSTLYIAMVSRRKVLEHSCAVVPRDYVLTLYRVLVTASAVVPVINLIRGVVGTIGQLARVMAMTGEAGQVAVARCVRGPWFAYKFISGTIIVSVRNRIVAGWVCADAFVVVFYVPQ
jgi:hypothetical protein